MTLVRAESNAYFPCDWALAKCEKSIDDLTEDELFDAAQRMQVRRLQSDPEMEMERTKNWIAQQRYEDFTDRAWKNLLAALERMLKYTNDRQKIVDFVISVLKLNESNL